MKNIKPILVIILGAFCIIGSVVNYQMGPAQEGFAHRVVLSHLIASNITYLIIMIYGIHLLVKKNNRG